MWATSPGKKQGSTFHFSIRCPVKTDAESDSSTTSSSSSLDHELSVDIEKTAQSRDEGDDPGNPACEHLCIQAQNLLSVKFCFLTSRQMPIVCK